MDLIRTGTVVAEQDLVLLGFSPLALAVRRLGVSLPEAIGCDWDTVGQVPDGPGHYLFSVEHDGELRVTYVGLTTHLWMVTKGQLPRSGGARGGQRYGRPTHAGATRRRINIHVAEELQAGRAVRHWVRRMSAVPADPRAINERLRAEEEELIVRWQLRQAGWNRG
jgi:hypothetical protein